MKRVVLELVLVLPLLLVQGMLLRNAQPLERAKVLSSAGAIVSIVALVVLRYLARGGVGDEEGYAPLSQSHSPSKSRVQQHFQTVHGGTHLNGSGSDSNSACEHGGLTFALFFMVRAGGVAPWWWCSRALRCIKAGG